MSLLKGLFGKKGKKGPVLYTQEEQDALEDYIVEQFGDYDLVLGEVESPDVKVEIAVIKPTEEKNYYTLITMGMGAWEMKVPERAEDFARAELMMYMPADWDLNPQNPASLWPVSWLKILARLPIQKNDWLGEGHTASRGEPFCPETQLDSSMLVAAKNTAGEKAVALLPGEKKVNFYTVVALHEDETQFKMAMGMEKLMARFEEAEIEFPPVMDYERPNLCEDYGNLLRMRREGII